MLFNYKPKLNSRKLRYTSERQNVSRWLPITLVSIFFLAFTSKPASPQTYNREFTILETRPNNRSVRSKQIIRSDKAVKQKIIDAHAHCGIQDKEFEQTFQDYCKAVAGSKITGVVVFAPVMEIYDRWNPDFEDSPEWAKRRKRANDYLLHIKNDKLDVIPYFFIWNDFAIEQLTHKYKGIKWHRHVGEPHYDYDDPRCLSAIESINRKNLPVVLEEEFENTIQFVEILAPGVKVIIPHMGKLNGGYNAFRDHGLWKNSDVYVDTSLAAARDIMVYISHYGCKRLLFGSDFPFGDPIQELAKIEQLPISKKEKNQILGKNLQRLLKIR